MLNSPGASSTRRCARSAAAESLQPLEPRLVMTAFVSAPADALFRGVSVAPPTLEDGSTPAGFGYVIAALGDINADGRGDFAVGAPGARPDPIGPFTGTGRGYVFVYDGASNTVIRRLDDGSIGFGATLANLGDVNGDGVHDLAVGAPQWHAPGQSAGTNGRVAIFSGADGASLRSWEGAGTNFRLGAALSVGDINGDGHAELVVGPRRRR